MGLLGYLALGMEQPGLEHQPLKMAVVTLLAPPTELAAMRLTTTSRHQSAPTVGSARPKRSCASYNRRWMGASCCGADFSRIRGAKHPC